MTAVTQTEAFAKLDEGTVKDFIMKVTVFYFLGSTLHVEIVVFRLRRMEPSNHDTIGGGQDHVKLLFCIPYTLSCLPPTRSMSPFSDITVFPCNCWLELFNRLQIISKIMSNRLYKIKLL